jgi:ubiquinone/menaquinone biosynthesis C-methylase UbiE
VSQREYGRLDAWHGVASINIEQAREVCARLELRARSEDEAMARSTYLDLIAVAAGERALDVGCGSGVVARDMARRVAPRGVAVGVDPSPALLAVARELADRDGIGQSLELREGDARALPFADGEFDVVIAATALSHIPDGERAIPELIRVTRPGGRVGVFDRDPDSFIIAHPDRALTRRVVAAFSDHGSVDGWLARRLPGLLTEAGLRDVRVCGFTSLERGGSGFYTWSARRAAEVAVETGAISSEEQQAWLSTLQSEQASSRYLVGMTQLFVWGTRSA